MPETRYLALIGDVVASREMGAEHRAETQRGLRKILGLLNGSAGAPAIANFAAPLTLTAGDEVQALLRAPADAVAVVQRLTDHAWGSREFPQLVFGLGYGALATGPPEEAPEQPPNPALLDGPCFHRARRALDAASGAKAWARFDAEAVSCAGPLNALFDLMGAVRSGWARRQAHYAHQMRVLENQKAVANEWKVSPSVVSESLKAAHYKAVLAGEDAARALLRELGDRAAEGAEERV